MICGENSSGKSLYAEELVSRTKGKRYYIATMLRNYEENHARIEKHQKQRAHLAFTTLEMPYALDGSQLEEDSVVLLEDVSNILANVIFDKGGAGEQVFEEICRLQENCRLLFVVSIGGLQDQGYEGETARYIRSLNDINRRLFERCDVAIRMENRQPIYEKGGEAECC